MFKAPIKPNLKLSSEVLISNNNVFILSHSYRATITYGCLSLIFASISNILKSGEILVLRSMTIFITPESLDAPPPEPPYTSKIVSKMVSHI